MSACKALYFVDSADSLVILPSYTIIYRPAYSFKRTRASEQPPEQVLVTFVAPPSSPSSQRRTTSPTSTHIVLPTRHRHRWTSFSGALTPSLDAFTTPGTAVSLVEGIEKLDKASTSTALLAEHQRHNDIIRQSRRASWYVTTNSSNEPANCTPTSSYCSDTLDLQKVPELIRSTRSISARPSSEYYTSSLLSISSSPPKSSSRRTSLGLHVSSLLSSKSATMVASSNLDTPASPSSAQSPRQELARLPGAVSSSMTIEPYMAIPSTSGLEATIATNNSLPSSDLSFSPSPPRQYSQKSTARPNTAPSARVTGTNTAIRTSGLSSEESWSSLGSNRSPSSVSTSGTSPPGSSIFDAPSLFKRRPSGMSTSIVSERPPRLSLAHEVSFISNRNSSLQYEASAATSPDRPSKSLRSETRPLHPRGDKALPSKFGISPHFGSHPSSGGTSKVSNSSYVSRRDEVKEGSSKDLISTGTDAKLKEPYERRQKVTYPAQTETSHSSHQVPSTRGDITVAPSSRGSSAQSPAYTKQSEVGKKPTARKDGSGSRLSSNKKVSTHGLDHQTGDPDSNTQTFFFRENNHSLRFHPYPPEEVPYMFSYDHIQLDYDYMRYRAVREGGGMLPWCERREFAGFKPKKVLDVGCGIIPSWIVEASETWSTAEFVGLDIAPVLLDLSRVSPALHARATFVKHNFLHRWPLNDEEFDFVRIAFIGDGVPEHSWTHIFDEAARVLKRTTGWMQCIDITTITKPPPAPPNIDETFQTSVAVLEPGEPKPEGTDCAPTLSGKQLVLDPLKRTKNRSFSIAVDAILETYQSRMISPYPISMFPAAMLLVCRNIISEGPKSITGLANIPSEMSNSIRQVSDTIRLVENSFARAADGWSETFSPSKSSVGESTSLRDTISHEKHFDAITETMRSKANIGQLLKARFGWKCHADEVMVAALEKQATFLKREKQMLESQDSQRDDQRFMDTDRALQDVLADLNATNKRLGRPRRKSDLYIQGDGWDVSFSYLVKTGRKQK